MARTILAVTVILSLLTSGLRAQDLGSHNRGGYTQSRTYLNLHAGDFAPPFEIHRTAETEQLSDTQGLLVIANEYGRYLLVSGTAGGKFAYQAYHADTGFRAWDQPVTFGPSNGTFRYVPSALEDLLILGGPGDISVRIIRISTGEVLWEDGTVGDVSGRLPILTRDLAIYHGAEGVVAADPLDGAVVWSRRLPAAPAPLSLEGDRIYLLDAFGTLNCLSTRDGSSVWSVPGLNVWNAHIMATEEVVFFTSLNRIAAFHAADGRQLWERDFATPAAPPEGQRYSKTAAFAVAYGLLVVFTTDDGFNGGGSHDFLHTSTVSVHDPKTGRLIWWETESGTGIDFGTLANNLVYYFSTGYQSRFMIGETENPRIRVRDVFTGKLIWSSSIQDVRALSISGEEFFVLLPGRVLALRPVHHTFFAHVADGQGQRTLLVLSNPNTVPVSGQVTFFDSDGQPMNFQRNEPWRDSNRPFEIRPRESTVVETPGGAILQSGWARVSSGLPLSGSAVLQYSDPFAAKIYEAGVAASSLSGRAVTAVRIAAQGQGPSVGMALAVSNPSDQQTQVRFELIDGESGIPDFAFRTLEPGAHQAFFLAELFPRLASEGFQGTVRIVSSVPVVATALRTLDGFQLSSLPLADY